MVLHGTALAETVAQICTCSDSDVSVSTGAVRLFHYYNYRPSVIQCPTVVSDSTENSSLLCDLLPQPLLLLLSLQLHRRATWCCSNLITSDNVDMVTELHVASALVIFKSSVRSGRMSCRRAPACRRLARVRLVFKNLHHPVLGFLLWPDLLFRASIRHLALLDSNPVF